MSRIILNLVNKGKGDVEFLVKGTKIKGIKSILSAQNEIFDRLINDPLAGYIIQLPDVVSLNGINALFRYYGYGNADINTDNMMDALITSIALNEKDFCDNVQTYKLYMYLYIYRYVKDNISLATFNLYLDWKEYLSCSMVSVLHLAIDKFIRTNYSEILNSTNIINYNIEELKTLISIAHDSVTNETFFLNQLLYYYNYAYAHIEREIHVTQLVEFFTEYLKQIDWSKVKTEELIDSDALKLVSKNDIISSTLEQNTLCIYILIYNYIYIISFNI